eukprot:1184467-Prorocentrum_minimum.AAC.1
MMITQDPLHLFVHHPSLVAITPTLLSFCYTAGPHSSATTDIIAIDPCVAPAAPPSPQQHLCRPASRRRRPHSSTSQQRQLTPQRQGTPPPLRLPTRLLLLSTDPSRIPWRRWSRS